MPTRRASIVGRSWSRSTFIGVVALIMIVVASGSFNRTDIQLRRQGCFGTCPVYEVEITGDGLVTYNGRAFVAAHGSRQGRVSPAAVSDLVAKLGGAGFWALPAADSALVQGPASVLTVTSGLRSKTIRFGVSPPIALAQMADAVDTAAGAQRWTGTHAVITAPPTPAENLNAPPEPRH